MAQPAKGIVLKIWRSIKLVFLGLFLAQFTYIFLLKWLMPPVTITQLASLLGGHGLHRRYVTADRVSAQAKWAVIASEDQLFADHNGFDLSRSKRP